MSLHLFHLPIALRALHAWGEARGLVSRGIFDEGLALHHLLSETFGPSVLQPFRLMVPPRARTGALYGYAAQPAEILAQAAQAILDPVAAQVIDLAALRSQPRPETAWHAGQRLGFDLRVRPVVRLASPLVMGRETFRKGAEVDAYLSHVARTEARAETDHEAGRQGGSGRDAVYLDWLRRRLDGQADLDPALTRLAQYERRLILRNGRRADGPDATFHGTLTVTDPTGFAALLARGVGRHTAYGYGMLMLRPSQKTPQSMAPAAQEGA
ncbi:type I-E CRISPR-associated protein Cas6/Cse3/CasE [Citreicella sp. C3M06]|uniref:type I-E CRISPR-associated protein Cas6/Cse3/CasE n=1 Tax=Citreicella sp. C3M06 TaxID=2841564 RepID=UPI001C0852D1|nr:type I-E CRISPR-associated protein Cas6/Cse3/CasE [Citreicella sp. C3M06]MBU2962091.1 type I-E CRISPR-associated protein Cas6/Cse3/CasE [Citreicella sp. C3M06]